MSYEKRKRGMENRKGKIKGKGREGRKGGVIKRKEKEGRKK